MKGRRLFRGLSLSQLARVLGLLALEAASGGLAVWALRFGAEHLVSYTNDNRLGRTARLVLLADMFGPAAAVGLLALVVVGKFGRRGLDQAARVAGRAAPLASLGLVPFLFNWRLWEGRDAAFLVLAFVFAWTTRAAFMLAFSTTPIFPREHVVSRTSAVLTRRLAVWQNLPSAPTVVVCAGALAYAVYFSIITIINHWNFGTASFDMGLENNLLWNAVHGGVLFKSSPMTGPTGTHFGNHATFFAYVIGLVYVFYQHPETLLVVQALLIGFAAVPLYLYARRHVPVWTAVFVALCYLLYPAVHGSNLYDFHYLPLGPFFLWLSLYALDAQKKWLSVLAVMLTLSVREDVAANLVIIGAFLLLTDRRPRAGLVVAAGAGAYFVIMKMMIMPQFTGGESSFVYQYQGLLPEGEKGFGGILKTVIGNPVFTLNGILERDKIIYLLQLMVPLMFFPLRHSIAILLCLPGFFFTLLSTGYWPLYQISFQYPAHWTAFMFIGLVVSLARIGQPHHGVDFAGTLRRRSAVIGIAVATLVTTYQYGAFLQHNTLRGGFGRFRVGTMASDLVNRQQVRTLLTKIPSDAKIVASEMLVPQVSSRKDAYTLRLGIYDADYLLYWSPLGGSERERVHDALRSGQFGVLDQKGPFVLAKRGHRTDLNTRALSRL